jgi:hypothetical protein
MNVTQGLMLQWPQHICGVQIDVNSLPLMVDRNEPKIHFPINKDVMRERMHKLKIRRCAQSIIVNEKMHCIGWCQSAYPWDEELSIHLSKASFYMFTGNDTEAC